MISMGQQARWRKDDDRAQSTHGVPLRRHAAAQFCRARSVVAAAAAWRRWPCFGDHDALLGLTQDLFAAGEDGVGIAQALRWSSPSTALRYGRKLAARSNVAARVLSRIRA